MPAPRFRPFLKMSARGAGASGGTWVATEKLHGANFVVGVTADGVWFGKRKAWLAPTDAFFGWQLVAGELAAAARGVFARAGRPQVVLYGELFGGGYPHPEVAAVPGLQPVQTGVWYAPGLRWAPFDVLVASGDDDDGELLAFTDVEALAADAGPAPAERPIVKRKIAEMDEARFDESAAWQPGDVGRNALAVWAARLVNPARVASARSKVGGDPAQLADEVVLDVLVDLEAAFPEAWRALDDADLDRLAAIVRACPMNISVV